MITLYDSAFSPFARKVRLALEHKQIEYRAIDALARNKRAALEAVNRRLEVPTISHDGVVVVNSSDIIAYLERRWPTRSLYPDLNSAWAHARAWERCSDTLVDAILTNVSYWTWARREDAMPEGLHAAARKDLDQVYAAMERDLETREYLSSSTLSVADVALFPHVTAARAFGLGYDATRFPRVHAWQRRLRAQPAMADDLERTKAFLAKVIEPKDSRHDLYERNKIFWRGDRLEWMLARGFHGWLSKEIESQRVAWPGLSIPAPQHDPSCG